MRPTLLRACALAATLVWGAAALGPTQPVPSPALTAFSRGGISMFMHFGPCTFVDCQWDTQLAPPSVFNPTDLNTDQWFEAAALLGADEVCLTARHVDGFTLWPSASTNYSVTASPWRNGTGDVLADFVASAARAGIRPCFYIILGFNIYANKTGVPGPEYLQQQVIALTELLTRYGTATAPIVRLWQDNYALDGAQYQPVTHEGFVCPNNVNSPACPAWDTLAGVVQQLSPTTLMVPGMHGCLVNAEQDGGTYPLYRAAGQGSYWCTNAAAPVPPSGNITFMGVEADYSLLNPGDKWFWNPGAPILDVGSLWSQVTLKWGQGANLILNVPPDTTGQVPEAYMSVLREYRAVWNATYGVPVAEMGAPVSGTCPGLSIVLPLSPDAAFDQVWLEEDLRAAGQVVNGYTLEVRSAATGAWAPLQLLHGMTIGARIIDWGLGTRSGASALRFNCTASMPRTGAGVPATLRKFAAYLGAPLPAPVPALAASSPAAADRPDGSSSSTMCGEGTDRNDITLVLKCAAGVITGFDFASYGTPSGSCGGGNLASNASCNYAGTAAWAAATCVNQTACVLTAGPPLPDPCAGTIKSLAVIARCSGDEGGSVAAVVPPCSMTQGTPPCPLPTWEPVWALNRSTICQPGNTASWLDPVAAARWGLISLDWSVASSMWLGNGNASNMTGAATLVEQCRRIKQVDPTTKCLVYRNTELALEWMEPHRAVMDDPAFAAFFLQYQPGNPQSGTPGTPYNEDAGAPATGLRQFFWNYSNPDAFQYVLGVSEQGVLGTASPWVDGTFLDDSQAVPQEHPNAPANMGLSPLQLITAQNDTYRFFNTAVATLAATGKYIWQGFNGNEQGDPDGVGAAPNSGNCAAFMLAICTDEWQSVPSTMQWPSAQADKLPVLAAFLVSRGPYSYIGYGWNGGPLPEWDPLWDAYDVGMPTGGCVQGPLGVFSRAWTKGTVVLDCNTWTAVLPFPSL